MMEIPGSREPIDAKQPWWQPLLPLLASIHGPNWRAALNAAAAAQGLTNWHDQPLSFVPQQVLPPDCAYESFIFETGQVPTRENLHDYLNGLIWLAYPAIKQQLNRMQAGQIAQNGIGQARTPVRDALTLFDENAALLVLHPGPIGQAMHAALVAQDWASLFVLQREQFGNACHVLLFGHALLEKLCQPYKAITGHAWPLWGDADFFAADLAGQRAWVDARVAQQLAGLAALPDLAQTLTTRVFSPLPVAGVPDWWRGQDRAFYADSSVFRPASGRPRPTLLPLPVAPCDQTGQSGSSGPPGPC